MNPILNLCTFYRISLFVAFLSASFFAHSDWINLTGAETSPNIAEIYVLDDQVKVKLEVYVGDLDKFEELLPDEWFKDLATNRPSLERRMQIFAAERLQFITEDGTKLSARLELAEPRMRIDRMSPFAGMVNPYTRQRVGEAPADKRVLYVELSYPFKIKPKILQIVPPADDQGRALVSFGFIAYHKSVPIIDFRYLGAPVRLTLDWDDPWYSKFANRNLKRHHKSAMMSYLYVEPYEVRHEVLTRVKDLQDWMGLGLRGDEYIEIDELDALRQRIGDFFLSTNPLFIDGQLARPILDRTNYVKVGLKGIQLLEKPERLDISTAIVGVIISYITAGLPQEVSIDWQLFNDQIQQIPTTATDPAGPFSSYISPDDNNFVWTNYLKKYKIPTITQASVDDTLGMMILPWGTMLCFAVLVAVIWWGLRRQKAKQPVRLLVAMSVLLLVLSVAAYPYLKLSVSRPTLMAGEMPSAKATELLQVLLKNVYRAFDFRDENDVYDKLALSVDGDLLEDIYLQNRKSFSVQQAGGAQAKIKHVEVMEATATRLQKGSLAYKIKARWSALGTVGHWGHLHQRKNQYDALIDIKDDNGVWKITRMDLLEEQRVDPFNNAASNDINSSGKLKSN